MKVILILVVFTISLIKRGKTYTIIDSNIRDTGEPRHFPDGFLFGTATSSYQVEGAWNASDKGENIWDRLSHTRPKLIADHQSGDVSDNSYYNYKRDVEMIHEMGLDFYRISLSWSRILPTGLANQISKDGVAYYNNLINEMLKYNITPVVTIYHWDLPQGLQDFGGWANPLIIDWYTDYAKIVFEEFGDRVKMWITINEPHQICHLGYGSSWPALAPYVEMSGVADYLCAYNLLKAHAEAWRLYDKEFRSIQRGRVGFVISFDWFEAATNDPIDIQAAEDHRQFLVGIYANPIFSSEGDFPLKVREYVEKNSKTQGYSQSRLPKFTPAEVQYIKGTADFFGLNHYTTNLIYRNETTMNSYAKPSFDDDKGTGSYQDPSWIKGNFDWLKVVPWGIRSAINFIKDRYNNPNIIITENGFSTFTGLRDDDRVSYFRTYLEAVLDSIYEDGCNVTGYTAWSLMDNYEWNNGYTERFGLYEVDYSSPERTRTARKSALVYKEMVRSRSIDHNYQPNGLDITQN